VAVVVVVVDRGPDVVQHAGRPEQLPLGVAQIVQPGGGEPLEHGEREGRHPAHVVRVGVEPVGQVLDRRAAHVLEQLVLAQQALEEHPLAQARLGHLDPVESARVEGGGQDQGAAQDHVAAVGLDAREVAALGGGPGRERVDQLLERVARQLEALDVERGHVDALHGGRGEVPDRAAHADEVRAVRPPAERGELARHPPAQRLDRLRGGLLAG
jgi:hypothetical protein